MTVEFFIAFSWNSGGLWLSVDLVPAELCWVSWWALVVNIDLFSKKSPLVWGSIQSKLLTKRSMMQKVSQQFLCFTALKSCVCVEPCYELLLIEILYISSYLLLWLLLVRYSECQHSRDKCVGTAPHFHLARLSSPLYL